MADGAIDDGNRAAATYLKVWAQLLALKAFRKWEESAADFDFKNVNFSEAVGFSSFAR
jgi:hypothetical protein